jgi:hypothetical protein
MAPRPLCTCSYTPVNTATIAMRAYPIWTDTVVVVTLILAIAIVLVVLVAPAPHARPVKPVVPSHFTYASCDLIRQYCVIT